MTGYGRGMQLRDGREMTVELRSVNHRFLDVAFRGPRSLGFLEEEGRRILKDTLSRGHVDIALQYRNLREDARQVVFDWGLLSAYMQALDEARERFALKNDKSISMLSQMEGVYQIVEREEDREQLTELFADCMKEALSALIGMREREGEELKRDVLARLAQIEHYAGEIGERAPGVVSAYRERLALRVAELMDGAAPDETRVAQEVAIMADRCAIDEELVRLASHIAQMRATLGGAEASGRKLDFLVQELNREANTIGAKANELAITERVVLVKSEIEKVREQVQNIE